MEWITRHLTQSLADTQGEPAKPYHDMRRVLRRLPQGDILLSCAALDSHPTDSKSWWLPLADGCVLYY